MSWYFFPTRGTHVVETEGAKGLPVTTKAEQCFHIPVGHGACIAFC